MNDPETGSSYADAAAYSANRKAMDLQQDLKALFNLVKLQQATIERLSTKVTALISTQSQLLELEVDLAGRVEKLDRKMARVAVEFDNFWGVVI